MMMGIQYINSQNKLRLKSREQTGRPRFDFSFLTLFPLTLSALFPLSFLSLARRAQVGWVVVVIVVW